MQPVCDDFFEEPTTPAPFSSMHLNSSVRAYLDAVRGYLLSLHEHTESARRINREHADLIDRLIRKLFRLAEDRYFDHYPRLNFRIAVVAVGGYGRQELSLGSDIDLLFLYRGKMNPYIETITETITTRLWDARLIVGSATRTIRHCLRVGTEDRPTMTSYLDARFLIGDPGLYAELMSEVRQWIREHSSEFIHDKLEEQTRRHEATGESLFLLQPNIRESVGGLRDYHTALWCARVVRWEVRRAEHLLLHGFIDARERDALLAGLDFLWRLRNELHRDGRKNDRLHFVAQEQIAQQFGFEKKGDRLPIEQLMQTYYRYARSIERVSKRAIEHTRILDAKRQGRRHPSPRPIEEGFVIAEGLLQIPSLELIEERPVRLFAAIFLAQKYDVELSLRAQRLLRQCRSMIDEDFCSDLEASRLFRSILEADNRVYRSLRWMEELGLLGAYLPEFGEMVSLWQHDMYHTYTVDVHSLFLVEQLRRLGRGLFAQELPFATELLSEVRAPFTLYLSCILHDIGKGRGGAHSEKGAKMVAAIGARLSLQADEIEEIERLVRHHLTMSSMAEQRDVHDPRQILKLAQLVGTRKQLRNLYLLTIADIRSVSPGAWTHWKARLLEVLYRNTAEWFEADTTIEAAPRYFLERAMDRAAIRQHEALEHLEQAGVDPAQAASFLDSMPRRYLLHHAPEAIAAHVESAVHFLASDREFLIDSFPAPPGARAYWGLIVLARDQTGLLSNVAGVLAALGHDILAAQVYTNRESLAMEIFRLDVIPGGPAEEAVERRRITRQLGRVLSGEVTLPDLLRRHASRSTPRWPHSLPPELRITNEESDFYSILDVTAANRRALLHDITRALRDSGIDVSMSRVSTRANRVTDTFYVTDENGHKLLDDERRSQLEQAVLQAIRQEGP